MDDPSFKAKYQKYKIIVKEWERDFRKRCGRIPSKHDIREAPKDIRGSYKMYYKLKTSYLEDTLSDVLSEDGFDVLGMSQTSLDRSFDSNANESINDLPIDMADIGAMSAEMSTAVDVMSSMSPQSEAMTDANATAHEFEAVDKLTINDKAWSGNVSNKPTAIRSSAPTSPRTSTSKTNLKLELFTSKSFSKRNPRKALLRPTVSVPSHCERNSICDRMQPNELPDLETILIEKCKEQRLNNDSADPAAINAKAGERKMIVSSHLDAGWLSRNTTTTIADDVATPTSTSTPTSTPAAAAAAAINSSSNFGLANVDVTKLKTVTVDVSNAVEHQALATPSTSNATNDDDDAMRARQIATDLHSDSDAVVGDSEGEHEHEYRHLVKRRCVEINGAIDHVAQRTVKVVGMPAAATSKVERVQDDDDRSDDVDDDDDRDADYVGEKPKRTKMGTRKSSIKRTSKARAKEKTATAKRTKVATKKTKNGDATATRRSTRRQSTTTTTAGTDDAEQAEEGPPDINDLKYSLALQCGEVASRPRINVRELESADIRVQRYLNSMTTTTATVDAVDDNTRRRIVVDEKRTAARRELERKMNAGKLNENFVRINIEKKKFVRGKKTITYSKYKKKLWQHKKRVAALAGPNMDMGGCDGGVATCFTCGQTGHFARNCKLQGDTLLPLSAQLDDDPSPFPTLEEASEMATHSAVAVHCGNLAKLPPTMNEAIYKTSMDDEDDDNNDGVGVVENVTAMTPTASPMPMLAEAFNADDDDVFDDFIKAADMEQRQQLAPLKNYVGHKIPEDFLVKAGLHKDMTTCGAGPDASAGLFKRIPPMYNLQDDGTVMEATPAVMEALQMFGHRSFRKGQDRAIMRILSGLSTLVTLSTGSGKSLCYQLPAYMYSRQAGKCITLVISPLVSLMEDQVTGVPHFLRAFCLHTNQTAAKRADIVRQVADGGIDILLVSPEAIVAGERSTGFGSILRQLPPIAFACIDEVHCVSQWSHNFRPSYLMICKVLKKNLGVRTILGLTATATLPTRQNIIEHLSIGDGVRGIISDVPLPNNLLLSISKDANREAALIELLNKERFIHCHSIVIYCTRRDECERLAAFIRTYFQSHKMHNDDGGDDRKRKRSTNWEAEPYHAGMPASRRRTIQRAFMRNELRIVVATIAFGMGINKPDIRAVIHYNMPKSFESYVQEIGRAGRDGELSHCHLFLDARGGDQNELRRHIYANSIDRHVIRKLLQRIFVPCSCKKQNMKNYDVARSDNNNDARPSHCPGHEVGFSIEATVEALDIPSENISTLLCYLELDTRWRVNVLSCAYIMAKVVSYSGSKYLKYAAKRCPPLAMAIALGLKNQTFDESANIITFSVMDVASAIGWHSGVVKYQLKNLEWHDDANGIPTRSPLSVNYFDLGFHVNAPGDFTIDEIDEALDVLYQRSVKQEKTQLIQLQYIYQGLSSVAYNTCTPCSMANFPQDRSEQLKGIIRDYFANDYPEGLQLETINDDNTSIDRLLNDVRSMLNLYPDNKFSGRTLARIFHGISSPNFPALVWGRCNYWRAHSMVDFNRIVQVANSIIVKMRT